MLGKYIQVVTFTHSLALAISHTHNTVCVLMIVQAIAIVPSSYVCAGLRSKVLFVDMMSSSLGEKFVFAMVSFSQSEDVNKEKLYHFMSTEATRKSLHDCHVTLQTVFIWGYTQFDTLPPPLPPYLLLKQMYTVCVHLVFEDGIVGSGWGGGGTNLHAPIQKSLKLNYFTIWT